MSDGLTDAMRASRYPDKINKMSERHHPLPTAMWDCDCCGGIWWTTGKEKANYCPYCSTEAIP